MHLPMANAAYRDSMFVVYVVTYVNTVLRPFAVMKS